MKMSLLTAHVREYSCLPRSQIQTCLTHALSYCTSKTPDNGTCKGARMEKLAKKLREKTPLGKLDELEEGKHPYQEKDPLPPFPGGVNPKTGEIGGPRGPEPTRYGDWERKGRVTDF